MRFQNIVVKSSLYTNILNPVVFALCQRMTCIWIHIWTGAYMLKLSIGDDPLLLVSRRQRSWMLLLSEIPEQENMQNFPKWVHYHYLMYQPALFIKSRWCACYVRISAGMQIRCQALSLPISMRFIFALQKWQWTHAPRLLSKRTLRHDLRFLWGSLFVCLFELKSDSCSSFFSASSLPSAESCSMQPSSSLTEGSELESEICSPQGESTELCIIPAGGLLEAHLPRGSLRSFGKAAPALTLALHIWKYHRSGWL